MVQLIIDHATNKIMGYNSIIPQDKTDIVLVSELELKQFSNQNNLYYEDGKIVEKEVLDDDYQELQKIDETEKEFKHAVDNEQKIFMDNILAGKSIEEAASITKTNREQLENAKRVREQFDKKYYEKRMRNIIQKFEKEEESIEYKYFLSILTAVRDENEYLEEWINYHVENLGVEHFYIYDNESVDSVQEYLESINYKYLDKVTVISWETSAHTQQDTCNDWLQNYGSETKWFICMDVDEFIKIKEGQDKTLIEFLNENSSYSSIKCKWKHFTANGRVEKTPEPVMERFTTETDWNDWRNGGKYFAQSNRISSFISYVPQVRLNMETLDFNSQIITDFYQLNHYFTKSYEEYLEKIHRGSVNPGFMRKYQEFFEINPDMNHLNTGETFMQHYGHNINFIKEKTDETVNITEEEKIEEFIEKEKPESEPLNE